MSMLLDRDDHRTDYTLYEKDSAATTAEQWASEEVQIRSKLESIGGCANGYAWNRIDGGWQCSGGGHTVTDDQLA